jgi:hypothetical protein
MLTVCLKRLDKYKKDFVKKEKTTTMMTMRQKKGHRQMMMLSAFGEGDGVVDGR